AARARRIDGEHCKLFARVDEVHTERFDERRLAGTRRAADTDTRRATRRRHELVEQGRGFLAMICTRRLDERDRARQGTAIAGAYRVGELGHAALRPVRTNARISDAARGMLLPGPNTAATPASRKNA